MRLSKNHFYNQASIFILVFFIIPFNIFPVIFGNGSGGGYIGGEPEREGINNAGTNQIEAYVIEGAGYFLEANSDIMRFLSLVEKPGGKSLDFNAARASIEGALRNMNQAVIVYNRLIDLAERTPYNGKVSEQLMNFDYHGFMTENGLNSAIYKDVEEYLGRGDITGIYRHTRKEFLNIVSILVEIRKDISMGKYPDLSKSWELNEISTITNIFGSYVSKIFYNLKGE